MSQALVADLERALGKPQVKFDHMSRLLYSTDASNYQIMPIGVTFPRTVDDVAAIHEIAGQHKAPILPRGGGSSLAGQTVGHAVVMDFSRYMRRVRSINAESKMVEVDSGLVLGKLNAGLRPLGLMYGPDPASAERATVGGCIGNNATGAHSILYGMTADNIQRLEVVLADGERTWLDANTERLRALRQSMAKLAQEHQDEIAANYPKTFRSAAGYLLNKIDPEDVNLNWLFAGSEGTLGTIVGAELKLVDYYAPSKRRLALVHFSTVRASLEATPRILEVNPSAVELMDRFLMNKTRGNPEFAPKMSAVEGDPAAVLIVEFYGEDEKELEHHIAGLKTLLNAIGHQDPVSYAVTPQEQANVWAIRKAGLGLLMSERGDAKPIAFVEDAAVPVEHLADYIDEVEDIIHTAGTEYAVYAHASAGCLHVRPLINLKSEAGRRQYRQIGDAVAETVKKYQGAITGEHGKGLARGEYTRQMFGDRLTEAFREIKGAFDPDNRMNPGKIIDPTPMDDPATLRYTPQYEVLPVRTRYDWSSDYGFNGAVEMCNGSGVCRKEDSGTMCPSYMATLDEAHSTRGRANALRSAISGKIPEGLGSQDVFDVFDLCLACKACKAECPSSVDVARMKAEFLASYHDAHGVPLKNRVFANVHRLNRLGSLWPAAANFMLSNPLSLWAAKVIGMPTERPLPKLATKRFSTGVGGGTKSQDVAGTLVIDTFTEYNHPEIGRALQKIVDRLGVRLAMVRLPDGGCCGRPAISKGLLDQAKGMADANIQYLHDRLEGAPFLFLEPSCQSAFVDDYPTLASETLQERARTVANRCMSVEAWLVEQIVQHGERLQWIDSERDILLHGHCHQKALWGTGETVLLLESIPGANVQQIDSGCCGVAGSFGYEHYALSLKIGEDRLLPTIREHPEAIVAAPGTSCRAQISDAGLSVRHPVEVVAKAIQ